MQTVATIVMIRNGSDYHFYNIIYTFYSSDIKIYMMQLLFFLYGTNLIIRLLNVHS